MKRKKMGANTLTAVAFVLFIFYIMAKTLSPNASRVTGYLKNSALLNLKPTFEKISRVFDEDLYLKDQFCQGFGLTQRLLGVTYIDDPLEPIVKDQFGSLHYLRTYRDLSDSVQSLSELAALCRENDVSLTYLMPPSTILKGVTRLPMGVVDDTDAVCSEFVDLATQKGIDVLDMRTSILQCGLKPQDIFMKTDHHWHSEVGLWVAKQAIEHLSLQSGVEFANDPKIFDVKNYQRLSLSYLGSKGKMVGKWYAGVDTYHFLYPNFDTDLKVSYSSGIVRQGSFYKTIQNTQYTQTPQDPNPMRERAYLDFLAGYTQIENKNGKGSVLIVNDSYGLNVAPFMSLCTANTTIVNPRMKGAKSVNALVKSGQYDCVLFIYSPYTLTSDIYFDGMFDFS